MYEASFGLKRRPFAATPDATCFLSTGPIQAVLDELVVCVEQGQGISVLTAPAGTGKTLLCERLRFELDERFETVFLRHSSFLTRRALLQTVLCELSHPYHHPSEQELRLELFPAIRALQPKREALVLICDEAHQLPDSLLEELRILADFAEAGRPLVRLVLVGQLSLEEKLAQPSLEAFNQRIRAQINLSTFDHAGSIDYIDYRLTWAGGRTDEVFTPAALDLIARVSDGVPRCINQLADHTLLLAFVAEQRPAGEDLVREALSDLRQLPLHWNEPSESRAQLEHTATSDDDSNSNLSHNSNHSQIAATRDYSGYLSGANAATAMYSYEPEAISEPTSGWIALPNVMTPPPVPQVEASFESSTVTKIEPVEVRSDDWQKTKDLFSTRSTETTISSTRLTEITAESFATTTIDPSTLNLTRRMQFHDLLQDAYAAAAKTVASTEQLDSSTDFTSNDVSDQVEIPAASQAEDRVLLEIEELRSTITSTNESYTRKSTSDFVEEVIVDRYAAIDGGFTPPVASQPDTVIQDEVRAEEPTLETSWTPLPYEQPIKALADEDVESFEPGVAFEQHEFVEIARQFDGQHLDGDTTIDFQSQEEPATAIDDSSTSNELSVSQVDELTSLVTSEVIETTLITRHIRSEREVVWTERSDQNNETVASVELDNAAFSPISNESAHIDSVERVADEVYSLGQSLHPAGALSSSSESILKALRREVTEMTSIEAIETGYQPSTATVESAWESIETTPVPVAHEPRPFRYLFSMLRRKQQGLA